MFWVGSLFFEVEKETQKKGDQGSALLQLWY